MLIFGPTDCVSCSLGVAEANSGSQSIRKDLFSLMNMGCAFCICMENLVDITNQKYISA